MRRFCYRGALTLGTVYASPHDAFIIPELNLKGRVASSYAFIIHLSFSSSFSVI